MTSDLDPHGQPFNLLFNRARRAERDLSEMLGLAKGLLADGTVSEAEAQLLRDWASGHPDAAEQWPVNVLKERLDRIFTDGSVGEVERKDLSALLSAIVGGTAGVVCGADAATALPVDDPPPELVWRDSVFVYTGRFAFGTRADCQRQALRRGGICEGNVTQRTRYLIIGTFGSRDWVHTPFGRKIETAVKYREAGLDLAIVAEEHWARCLG